MDRLLIVMLGGAFGSAARYVMVSAIINRIASRLPLGTFAVNILGCFAVGIIMTLLTERLNLHPNWRLLLVTGFFGGYTTFSSFEYEAYTTSRTESVWLGLAYAVGSLVLGYVAVWLGASLVRRH